jgi:hypothetical protein
LIIKGKKYGIQIFIVPLRDLKTEAAFPGVVLGDIGPKIGYVIIFLFNDSILNGLGSDKYELTDYWLAGLF